MKRMVVTLLAMNVVLLGAQDFGDFRDAETLSRGRGARFEIVSYALVGGAVHTATGAAEDDGVLGAPFPAGELGGGFQITKWLAVGGFFSAAPLSDFDHARFGITVADRDNAYAVSTGTELLFTPFSDCVVHPMLRVAIGGTSFGYAEDQDGIEGFESVVESRVFFAAVGGGVEVNVSRHLRAFARVGWRYVNNEVALGIGAVGLSGLESVVGVRVLWRTVVD